MIHLQLRLKDISEFMWDFVQETSNQDMLVVHFGLLNLGLQVHPFVTEVHSPFSSKPCIA